MKIVILDGHATNPGDLSWEEVEKLGETAVYPRSTTAQAIERIGDAEVVLTNKVPITREIMDACPNIRYVGLISTGTNIMDLSLAKERGIAVTNVPGYSTDSVAQMAIALLLSYTNRVAEHAQSVRGGKWSKSKDYCFWDYPIIELAGKTLGVIGLGQKGQATARIAAALGMKTVAYSRTKKNVDIEQTDLDDLLSRADYISLNCPLTEQTKNLICRENIAKMKDGAVIINTGRGPLVDNNAVCDALDSGKLAAFLADVNFDEPPKADDRLIAHEKAVFTPHIAWASIEARSRLVDAVAENLRSWMKGGKLNRVEL